VSDGRIKTRSAGVRVDRFSVFRIIDIEAVRWIVDVEEWTCGISSEDRIESTTLNVLSDMTGDVGAKRVTYKVDVVDASKAILMQKVD
jgi:hypothetical protein